MKTLNPPLIYSKFIVPSYHSYYNIAQRLEFAESKLQINYFMMCVYMWFVKISWNINFTVSVHITNFTKIKCLENVTLYIQPECIINTQNSSEESIQPQIHDNIIRSLRLGRLLLLETILGIRGCIEQVMSLP